MTVIRLHCVCVFSDMCNVLLYVQVYVCVCVCLFKSTLFTHTWCETECQSVCLCGYTTVKTFARLSRNHFHSELTWRYLGVIVCPCCIQYCTMCVHILCVHSEWLIHYRTTYVHTKAYIIYSGKILIWRKFRSFGLFYVKF